MIGMDQKDYYCGSDALSKRHLLNFAPVIDSSTGGIANFDELELFLRDIMIHDLKTSFEDTNVLITEQPD